MHDVERVYVLNRAGDVIAPGKCVMRWGKTPKDENVFAERFAKATKEKYPFLEIIPTLDIETATKESDIIDCVTLASEPFVKGKLLKKGALVMNIAD